MESIEQAIGDKEAVIHRQEAAVAAVDKEIIEVKARRDAASNERRAGWQTENQLNQQIKQLTGMICVVWWLPKSRRLRQICACCWNLERARLTQQTSDK